MSSLANFSICDFLCAAEKVMRNLDFPGSTVGGRIAEIKNPFSEILRATSKTFLLSPRIITTIADCGFGKFINWQKYAAFSKVFLANFFWEIIFSDANEAARIAGGSAVE